MSILFLNLISILVATQRNIEKIGCYDVVDEARSKIRYVGEVNVTRSGRQCQRWKSQRPHLHRKTPRNYPNKGLSENYCRDPDNTGYPWCFTTDPKKKRERCDIADCRAITAQQGIDIHTDCYTLKHIISKNTYQVVYGGNVSHTIRGILCQKWTSQQPNSHDRTPQKFPFKGLGDHNYCRDPDETGYPWCYTSQAGVRWEGCSVPLCAGGTGQLEEQGIKSSQLNSNNSNQDEKKKEMCTDIQCTSTTHCLNVSKPEGHCCPICGDSSYDECYGISENNIILYDGNASVTASGKMCQFWTEELHKYQNITSVLLGNHNYCRDPDNSGYLWCYINGTGSVREVCNIQRCSKIEGKADTIIRGLDEAQNINCQSFKEGNKNYYKGQTNVTRSGRFCQKWTESSPHFHTKLPDKYPRAGLGEHNFCRDPDRIGRLWCYTLDPVKRFDFCDISDCSEDDLKLMELCEGIQCGSGGDCYITKSGQTACLCQPGFIGIEDTCVDIDECKLKERVCKDDLASCVNKEGTFDCVCPKSYYWNNELCVNASSVPNNPECYIPEFVKMPHSRYDVTIGEDLIIECEGGLSDLVFWTKGLDGEEMRASRRNLASTLILQGITNSDIHVYRCVLVNECTGFTKVATVDLQAKVLPCSESGLQKFGMVWDEKDFHTARQYCVTHGLAFALPKTKSEKKIFNQDAWKSFFLNPNGKKFRDTNWIWVAATDREKENRFTDMDGVVVKPAKWWPGNPDNYKIVDPAGQDEVAYHLYSGSWNDSYGFIPRPFACECSFGSNEH